MTLPARTDEATKQHFGVADVTLAPLAAGEYVLELSLTKGGKTEVVTYGFRIIYRALALVDLKIHRS